MEKRKQIMLMPVGYSFYTTMVHHRVKASREEIIKSLEGNCNDAQLFIMKQSYDAYCFPLKQIEELDLSIEQ